MHRTTLGQALGEFRHPVLSSMAAETSTTPGNSFRSSITGRLLDLAANPDASSTGVSRSGRATSVQHQNYRQVLKTPVIFTEETIQPLFEKYIDAVHWRYPFCDELSLRDDFAQTFQQRNDGVLVSSGLSIPHKVVCAYLAVATAGSCSDDTSSRFFSAQVHATALNLFSQHAQRMDPISLLRCIVVLTIHSLYTYEAGQTWCLLGSAMSKAVSLGIDQLQLDSDATKDSETITTQSQLFRVLYLLDRTVSYSLHRPFAIDSQEVLILPPSGTGQTPITYERKHLSFESCVDYFQLMDCLRQTSKPMDFYFGAFYGWRGSTSLSRYDVRDTVRRELYLRCCCRALTQLLHQCRRSTTAPDNYRRANFQHDAVQSALDWYSCLSEIYEDDGAPISILDAYDIVNVGIGCTVIYTDSRTSNLGSIVIAGVPDIVAEGVALLSALSNRFPAVKPLRKALALCARMRQLGTPGPSTL